METEDKSKDKHKKEIVTGSPLTLFPPEMCVLYHEFRRHNPQKGSSKLLDLYDDFDKWYKKLERKRRIWIDNIRSGKDRYRIEHLSPRIRKELESIADGRIILDVGCGTGEGVIPYLKPNQMYLGVDTSKICLEEASLTFNIPIIDYSGNSGEKRLLRFGGIPAAIPFGSNNFFDEVIVSMVLHHVEDYKTSIDSIVNLVKPGGRYFIVTFDSDRRKQIEKLFDPIKERIGNRTVGDFNLPDGKLEDEVIYFHNNEDIHKLLLEQSKSVTLEDNANLFKIFIGTKKRLTKMSR